MYAQPKRLSRFQFEFAIGCHAKAVKMDDKTTPKVSVLMPVYNGECFLQDAVESILAQTFRNFEFVIIDDGSTDGTSAILDSFNDPRIVRLKNDTNLGLNKSLNRGLEVCQGEFIARMDADDISLPNRLEKQMAYLSEHPDVGILSCICKLLYIDTNETGTYQAPPTDLEIRWKALLGSPFAHPAVMMRRDVLMKNGLRYSEDEDFRVTQDYEFWTRILNVTRGANLAEPLVLIRLHKANLTTERRETQLRNQYRVALRTIREQLPDFAITLEQVTQLLALLSGHRNPDLERQRVIIVRLYVDLFKAFARRHQGERALKPLKHRVVWYMARSVLHFPLRPGWATVLGQILLIEPVLPGIFLRRLFGAGARRLERFLVPRNLK